MNETPIPPLSSSIQRKPAPQQLQDHLPLSQNPRVSSKSSHSSKANHQVHRMCIEILNNNKAASIDRQGRKVTTTTTTTRKSTKRPPQHNQDKANREQKIKCSKPNHVTSTRFSKLVASAYDQNQHLLSVRAPLLSVRAHPYYYPPAPVDCTPLRRSVRKSAGTTRNANYDHVTPKHGIRPKVLFVSGGVPEPVPSYAPGGTPLPFELPTPPWRTEQVGILLQSTIVSNIVATKPSRPLRIPAESVTRHGSYPSYGSVRPKHVKPDAVKSNPDP